MLASLCAPASLQAGACNDSSGRGAPDDDGEEIWDDEAVLVQTSLLSIQGPSDVFDVLIHRTVYGPYTVR